MNHQHQNHGVNMKRVSDEPPALIFREEAGGRKISRWGGRDILVNSIHFNPTVGVPYRCHIYDLQVGRHYFYVAEPTEETTNALAAAGDPAWCDGTVIAVLSPQVRNDSKNVSAIHPVTGRRIRFMPGKRVWVDVEQQYMLEEDRYGRKVTALPLHEPPDNALTAPDPNNPDVDWAFTVPEDVDAVLVSFKPRRKNEEGVIAFHRRFEGKPIFPAWGATVPVRRVVKVNLIEQDRRVIARPLESVEELKKKYPNAEFHTAKRPQRDRHDRRRSRRQDGQKRGNESGRRQGKPRQDECPKSQVDKFRERHGDGTPHAEKPAAPPLPESPQPSGYRPQSMAEQLKRLKAETK